MVWNKDENLYSWSYLSNELYCDTYMYTQQHMSNNIRDMHVTRNLENEIYTVY